MQSTLDRQDSGLHVAIIMDGNGRWAERRDLPRSAGHREGIEAVRRVVEAAPTLGISALTLFAFSSDNWRRPPLEVEVLMLLLRKYLRRDVQRLVENGVRLKVIGRRDRLPDGLADEIATAEAATARNFRLDLTVAIDYSARDAIANAATVWLGDHSPERPAFTRLLARLGHGSGRDVDLLDPHRRREAALRFPAVGVRLRGAAVHRNDVARLRRRASARRARRFSRARAPLRRPSWSRRNDFNRGRSMTDTTQDPFAAPPDAPA